ncbi:MAG: exodeoxyribonuclease III [Pseudomonadota bacterium]|nr:exodeoxyribonuclease III [Pseudomonadota bacterium]
MKLVTWNINSVRLRMPLLEQLTKTENPDVVCLQEIKVHDDLFPRSDIEELGYAYQHYRGMKGYNGVAILSRLPFASTDGRDFCGRSDCRHQSVTFKSGAVLHNFYVPAGGDVPDSKKNEKFAHKLAFLDEMTDWFDAEHRSGDPAILVGDLNIAPLATDVWSHKQLLKVVSHTPIEVEKLDVVQKSNGWVDAVRHFIPADEKLYSWWSYRARDWNAVDKGRRLDHVWVTPPLVAGLRSASVLRSARGWEKASDHAPVIVELEIH